METAGKLLHNHPEALPGVATTRLALVAAIVVFQSIQVSEGYLRLISTPVWIVAAILYPALFAISGFLLARSAGNHRPRDFVIRRARRQWPAMVVVVLLSSLALGPLATTKTVRAYATDPEFALYFMNILAFPRFSLPAVFQFNNAGSVVNLPLWLSPFVVCMVAIAALVPRFGTRLLGLAIVALLALVIGLALYIPDLAGFTNLQRRLLDGSGAAVLLSFLLGALGYQLRHRLPIHAPIAYLFMAILLVVSLFGNMSWLNIPAVNVLLAVPASYLAVFMVFQLLPLVEPALRLERYLLGFLLFSFPIQQLWITFGPRQQSFILNFLLSVPTTAVLAILVWHGLQRRLFRAGADDPRFVGASGQPLMRFSGRAIVQQLPMVAAYAAISLVLFALALGVMALTFLAFQPESGGV